MPRQTAPVSTMDQRQYSPDSREYVRQRYACRPLRVCRVHAPARVHAVMTWLLHRCVRDEPVVMGAAHVEAVEDFLTGEQAVYAWAYAYRDVCPDDVPVLMTMIDRDGGEAICIPIDYWEPV